MGFRIPARLPSGFLANGWQWGLTGHGTDASKPTAVVHDGSIALDLAIYSQIRTVTGIQTGIVLKNADR